MTRRALMILLMLSSQTSPTSEEDPATLFARAYNRWISNRQKLPKGTLDYQDVIQWQAAQSRWRTLEKAVEKEHRGE